MIAQASKSRQARMFPVCRVRFCRSVATESPTYVNGGYVNFWCYKHRNQIMGKHG